MKKNLVCMFLVLFIITSTEAAPASQPVEYDHVQTLEFEWSGYNTKVLKDPLQKEVVYTIQKGDKIQISKILDFVSEKKVFIKVKTPKGTVGYIGIGWNPYKDGEFSYLETLNVDGKDIKTLKMRTSFSINSGTALRSLPSEKSKIVHEISKSESSTSFKSLAISSDYKWVKMDVGGLLGWVRDESLEVGRGGPTIYYPEAAIFFDLIGGNEL